ncbi:MAG: SagB/ThcOx family dehydrogenase [Acidobacteriota bacterium]|nr:MAG: SagB/ThcOx family dehydrogenase [Acidobacteriota bacterium]
MHARSVLPALLLPFAVLASIDSEDSAMTTPSRETIKLPSPERHDGSMSLEQALSRRRSVREFTRRALTDEQLSQLLWAAQGSTRRGESRTAPSAGALYPLEVYVALPEGLYHYDADRNRLARHAEGDLRPEIYRTSLEQEAILDAPAVFVVVAVFERTAAKYGPRAKRYVWMEAGHAGQNLLLQATALGLGGVPIGAFYDEKLQDALALPEDHRPLYVIPVGKPARP